MVIVRSGPSMNNNVMRGSDDEKKNNKETVAMFEFFSINFINITSVYSVFREFIPFLSLSTTNKHTHQIDISLSNNNFQLRTQLHDMSLC